MKPRLRLTITFGIDDLKGNNRFTEEEVTAAIEHINEFGEGFRNISGYALNQIEAYIEEKYGDAANARCYAENERYKASQNKARRDKADKLGLRIVRLLKPDWLDKDQNVLVSGGTGQTTIVD